MADTVTSSSNLKIVWEFADGDTRTQNLPNPRSDIDADELQSFATQTKNNAVIIGDKTGAALTGIKSASIVDKSDWILDIS